MAWFRKNRKREYDDNVTSDEKLRRFISDAEVAEKLVNEYGGVLEVSAQLTFGAPKSLLPKPKEEIRNAIITYLLYLHATKRLDNNTFELLKVGYTQLATFLDEDEGKLAVSANSAFKSGDPERIASPDVKRAINRFSKCNEESTKLGIEFDAIAEKIGIQKC